MSDERLWETFGASQDVRELAATTIRERDTLRREVERLTAERDAAYAASLRSDEVHAEAMRAVRGRAEKAEAERDEARAAAEAVMSMMRSDADRARAAGLTLEAIRDIVHRYEDDEISFGRLVEELRALAMARAETAERDLTAARAQVERLRGALERMIATDLRCGPAHASALRDARAALADAAGEENSQ